MDVTIFDPDYKSTHFCLSQAQAKKRAELVSRLHIAVEYTVASFAPSF